MIQKTWFYEKYYNVPFYHMFLLAYQYYLPEDLQLIWPGMKDIEVLTDRIIWN